jgi:O-antigen/teichoic acid export membrane protein
MRTLLSVDPPSATGLPVAQKSADPFNTEHLHADLKGRSVRGGLMTLTSQGAQFIVQTASTMVLARLLVPADFGLVAMVTAITGLGQAFADLGLSEASIQREKIGHKQVSTLFWINVAIGLALTLLTAALAPELAWFYGEPRIRNITFLFSLTFLIGGLRVQHDALLRRQMRFSSLAIRDVASYALAVPVAILIAWKGGGYWALVALPLTSNLTQMTLSWAMAGWIPGLPRRDADVRSLISFGGKVAASYVICNASRSADSVLIGWYWGAGPLGLYSRAMNLLLLPVRQLAAPARSVAVPALSRTQNDPERFARYYLRVVNLIVWISTPLLGFLFVAAEPVIVVALGSRWRAAAPVFQILAISALGQLIFESTIWLFVSRGESQRLLKLFITTSPVIIGSFAIGLPFGIKGVALSGSLVLIGIFPWILRIAFHGTNLTLRSLWQAIVCPIFLCFAGVALAELALHLIRPPSIVSQLLVAALGFAPVYLFSALIPAVRREFGSFRKLMAEVGLFGSGPVPVVDGA